MSERGRPKTPLKIECYARPLTLSLDAHRETGDIATSRVVGRTRDGAELWIHIGRLGQVLSLDVR